MSAEYCDRCGGDFAPIDPTPSDARAEVVNVAGDRLIVHAVCVREEDELA